MDGKKHIVIVGAGFGGLAAAQALAGRSVDVTVIDRSNHHLFQPLLYQVATAALSPADIAAATRTLISRGDNVTTVLDNVTGVDPVARIVSTSGGARISYDYLVLASGADYSFFGHDEWAIHAPVLKTLTDALSIRERLLAAFERAEQSGNPHEIRALLTFVVVGGGPTGVEMAGAIAELARATLARGFRSITGDKVRVILVEAAPTVLSNFPGSLPKYAVRALTELGVDVRPSQMVSAIDADGLVAGNERIQAANIIWCAGTRARPAAEWIDVEAARNGAIKVRADCSVPAYPEIFAIGDVASYVARDGKPLPGLAPVAKQQGRYVGRLLRARIAGKREPGPFRYRNWGTMAVIGRSKAVAHFGALNLKGHVAWLSWSLAHLMLLIDFRSRLTVYVNWAWAWFTKGPGIRLLTGVQRSAGAETNTSRSTGCPPVSSGQVSSSFLKEL